MYSLLIIEWTNAKYKNWIRVQIRDKAAITRDFFVSENIPHLLWPARSPDLNIIENCSSRAVYTGNRQFDTIQKLKECIDQEWRKLSQVKIKKLYKLLSNRIVHKRMEIQLITR